MTCWLSLQFVLFHNYMYVILTGLVEHVLPLKNAMSPMGFDPGTSRIVGHCSIN